MPSSHGDGLENVGFPQSAGDKNRFWEKDAILSGDLNTELPPSFQPYRFQAHQL